MRNLPGEKTAICAGMLIFMLFVNLAARADDLDNITFQGVVRDGHPGTLPGSPIYRSSAVRP